MLEGWNSSVLADSGVQEAKEFHVDLLDSEENPNGSLNRENELCLFGLSHLLLCARPAHQIKEDGDPCISRGGSLQGHSLLTNILLWLEALPWSWSKLIYFIPFWATVKPTRATVTQLELSA